jgi:hypothetical protein
MRRAGLVFVLQAGTVNSYRGGGDYPFNFRMYTTDFEKILYLRSILTPDTAH